METWFFTDILPALNQLLQTVLIIGVPALCAYLGQQFKKWVELKQLESEDAYVKEMLNRAEQIVLDSVNMVSQTYVSNLKKDGKFSVEEQKIAFEKAFENTQKLVTDEAKEWLNSQVGDFELWVKAKIESAVKNKS